MAAMYGRGGVAKSIKDRGDRSVYASGFAPLSARDYLTGSDVNEYAVAEAAVPALYKRKQRGERRKAFETLSKLRQKAAARAFTDFSKQAMQYSKPWMVQTPEEGLITGKEMRHIGGTVASLNKPNIIPVEYESATSPGGLRGINYENAGRLKRGLKKGYTEPYSIDFG